VSFSRLETNARLLGGSFSGLQEAAVLFTLFDWNYPALPPSFATFFCCNYGAVGSMTSDRRRKDKEGRCE
jgi:hypothetical protein